jgi:hypothetical protein
MPSYNDRKANSSNVLSSTLIVGCILALIILAEKDQTPFQPKPRTTDTIHYDRQPMHDEADTTEAWLHIQIADSFDGIHIIDKDTNDIKIVLD